MGDRCHGIEVWPIKKAYLSAIRDLYDGSIVSYVLGHSNNNPLVFQIFDQAVALLDGEHPLIHRDRGFQYTSKGFKRYQERLNGLSPMEYRAKAA